MSQVAQLLRAFDDHGHTNANPALCSSKCYIRRIIVQDSSYTVERFVQGLSAPGTIRWQLAHLEHCARHYTAILRERPIVHEPFKPPPGTVDLPELIDRLERARQSLREEIVKLSDGFGRPVWPVE